MPESDGFCAALPSERVKEGRIALVEIGNQPIVVTRIDGELCAFSALCPHQLGDLSRGFLHNGEIECPVHGWRFNVRAGGSVYPVAESLRLRCFEVKEGRGMIEIKVQGQKTS